MNEEKNDLEEQQLFGTIEDWRKANDLDRWVLIGGLVFIAAVLLVGVLAIAGVR